MIHIGDDTIANFDLGLSTGRWAFPMSVQSPDVADIAVGDLVFFGLRGKPRSGGKLPGWETRTLSEAHVARVTRGPFINASPFWLDEIESGTVSYNPTIEIELLSTLGPTPLARGGALSAEATSALYRGAVSHKTRRVSTKGSPVLSMPSGATPRRPVRGGTVALAVGRSVPRFVAIEKKRSYKAIVKARPETVADPAESRLVHEYTEHLVSLGDDVCRLAVPLPSGVTIQNDIINKTRGSLIEAKGITNRASIRTAIGQVFDYRRFWKPKISGILLPSEPDADLLDLVASAGLEAVWPVKGGFTDTAGGALT
jgi:hypothetical protein